MAAYLDDAARQHPAALRHPPREAGDDPVAIWEGDVAYDDGDLDRPGNRHRLYMGRGAWRYEGEA